jgi:hypothetical protein
MNAVVQELTALANTDYAAAMARYFQVRPDGYGDGDVFIGIRLTDLRTVAKPYAKISYRRQDWLPLLASPVHEHRLLALLIMLPDPHVAPRKRRARSTATISRTPRG